MFILILNPLTASEKISLLLFINSISANYYGIRKQIKENIKHKVVVERKKNIRFDITVLRTVVSYLTNLTNIYHNNSCSNVSGIDRE